MSINTHITVEKILAEGEYGSVILARDQNSHKRVKCTCKKRGYEEGRSYHILGQSVSHPKYGDQIRIVKSRKNQPSINFYDALSQSDIWPSLTPSRLMMIREFASKNSMTEPQVLDDPWKIGSAISCNGDGIRLHKYWASIKPHEKVCTLLMRAGLGIDRAFMISKGLGGRGRELACQDPYQILYSEGADISLVKRVMTDMKIDENPFSAITPLYYKHLGESASKGNSGEIITSIAKKVAKDSELDIQTVLDHISQEAEHIFGDSYSVTKSIYKKEVLAANKIASLIRNTNPRDSAYAEKYTGDDFFTEEQLRSVINALRLPFSMITGGPGTGKTTTIKEVIKHLGILGYEPEIVTLSGKAADRASEASGHKAQTIHSLLGITPTSTNSKKSFSGKAIVVDESSMVDINLFYQLLRSVDESCKVILVGDINQLESIEPGAILEDISQSIPSHVTHLSKVQRFSEDSNINAFANGILSGEILYGKTNGLYTYQSSDNDHQHNINRKIIESYIKKNGNIDDLQVISPTWKGINGVTSMNNVIQDMIPRHDEKVLFLGKTKFYENDKVIARGEISQSGITTGQMLKISSIDYDSNTVELSSGTREFTISIGDISRLSLAFCITGHSSQGSEFKNVLFSITPQSEYFADKKMLYTIATRAKENLIISTPTGMMEKIIGNDKIKRKTFLADILSDHLAKRNKEQSKDCPFRQSKESQLVKQQEVCSLAP